MVRRPTIYDIATHAGVGTKTVSRVINDEPYVSDEVRKRVLESIRALDYRPNAAARVLRRDVSSTIAYVCGEMTEPVQAQLASTLSTVTKEHGFLMTASITHGDFAIERATLESLVAHQIDGIVLWPSWGDLSYLDRIGRGVPIVCVDQFPKGHDTDVVLSDNREGARLAVAHALSRGHRRIALVGDSLSFSTQRERLAGYQDAHAEAGLPVDAALIYHADTDDRRLAKQVAYWKAMSSPPTAVFSASSLSTTSLLHAITADDTFAIIAFDDFPFDDVLRGGITVVSQNVAMIGRIAGERLFARLGGERGEPTTIRVTTNLIARG